MTRDTFRNNDEVKMITDQVWKSMSLLRGILPVEHHHVYLFLLSVYYDEVIESVQVDFSNDLNSYLFSALDNDDRYSEVLNVYKPIIESIPQKKL